MACLLDADIFIGAKNLHYGFDFCPAFWKWLDTANAEKRVFSIERVGKELEAGKDELVAWAAERRGGFFLRPPPEMLASLGTVSDWVAGEGYKTSAIDEFLKAADYYLIAHALAGGHDVVTHEVPSDPKTKVKKKVKIPDVCKALDVKCVTPFVMLRDERARFVLGASA